MVDKKTSEKTVALGVCGSVAAYKSAEICRLLVKAGCRVVPIMTRSATEFLGPLTLSALCGEPTHLDMWDPAVAGELHVALAQRCDLAIIAPATADLLARLASGRADDLLTAFALVFRKPILIAPAMHPHMWDHPATQRNTETLHRDMRVTLVGPVEGPVASGEVGLGRMADPCAIVEEALCALTPKLLDGLHVVVSAGPTVEDLDPVRFLTNQSSGKMGFAIAQAARRYGAKVTLIAGPVNLSTPQGVERINIRSALQLKEALEKVVPSSDVLFMSAAVSDFRPATTHPTKLKRDRSASTATLDLVQNPDVLASIGAARTTRSPLLVGFAVETADDATMIDNARRKLREKNVDMVIVNHAAESLGRDDNRVLVVDASTATPFSKMSKDDLAVQLVALIAKRLGRESDHQNYE